MGGTSLWPQKEVCRSQIYSPRANFMQISDHFRDLVKKCFEGLKLPFTVPNNRSPSIIRISKHRTQNPSKIAQKTALGAKGRRYTTGKVIQR